MPRKQEVHVSQNDGYGLADAVDMLLADLPLLKRSRLATMTSAELDLINRLAGLEIARDVRLWRGNDSLLHACMEAMDLQDDDIDPTMVILRAMWQKLQEAHVLRLVK